MMESGSLLSETMPSACHVASPQSRDSASEKAQALNLGRPES